MKILVIGQAPPLKEQKVPYDTTLLYVMLDWIGITKDHAQDIFTFEAISDVFTGLTKTNGHKAPTKKMVIERVQKVIIPLIDNSEKVILFGRPVQSIILGKKTGGELFGIEGKYLLLPHPSRRNYNLILGNKEKITNLLNSFIKN